MKRTIFLFCCMAAIVSANSQVKIEVLGGGNLSRLSLKEYTAGYLYYPEDPNLPPNIRTIKREIKMSPGFFIGAGLEWELNSNLSLSSRMIVENVRLADQLRDHWYVDSLTGRSTMSLYYLRLPLHLLFYAPVKKARLFLGVGGYAAYGLTGTDIFRPDDGGRDSIEAVSFRKDGNDHYAFYHANRFDYGLSITAGIRFRSGLFLEASFVNGLRSITTDRYTAYHSNPANVEYGFKNYRRQFSLGIGYRLN